MRRTYRTLNDCEMQHNAGVGLFMRPSSFPSSNKVWGIDMTVKQFQVISGKQHGNRLESRILEEKIRKALRWGTGDLKSSPRASTASAAVYGGPETNPSISRSWAIRPAAGVFGLFQYSYRKHGPGIGRRGLAQCRGRNHRSRQRRQRCSKRHGPGQDTGRRQHRGPRHDHDQKQSPV